ncbi:MAG: efflux transporter outer membrane subunit [Betaproteobacteria bacterium]|nr:efflux transporter outer membrane subunit [Betaproteobacteria bacterium]
MPLALIAGCSLTPSYQPPTLAAPAAYKEDGAWIPAATLPPQPEKWWTAFADPVLNDLAERVTVDNQNIKLAEAQYRAARATVDSVRAGLYPTLGAGTSASRGITATGAPVTNLYALTAQANWELDLWGQVRSGVEAAAGKAQASEGALGAARLSTQALLAQTYFQMRAAEAQERLLTRTVAAYERFLELTQNRFGAGVASPLDVAQAQTQLLSARTQQADARLQRSQAEHTIATLLGKPPAEISIAPADKLATVPTLPPLLPSTTLETRWDIYSSERSVAAANAQIGVARSAYFPVLTLGANGGYRSTELSNLLSVPSRIWSLGPTLALTLFDGGARSAAVEQALAGYDQAVAIYRQTVLAAFQEVEDNLAAARWLNDESVSQNAALEAARKARQIAENQYRAGTASSLNVITAQASELAAEEAIITIWNRQINAVAQLYKNVGGRKISAEQSTDHP